MKDSTFPLLSLPDAEVLGSGALFWLFGEDWRVSDGGRRI